MFLSVVHLPSWRVVHCRPSDIHDYDVPMAADEVSSVMRLRPDFDPAHIDKATATLAQAQLRKNQQQYGV
jgi:hypothetical protein